MAKKNTLSPAELVHQRFGNAHQLSKELGISHSTTWRWKMSDGGAIPSKHHLALLALAKKLGVRLSEYELIHGGVL